MVRYRYSQQTFCLSPRRPQDVFKTCRQDMSSKHVFKTCLQDVFKACLQSVCKTSVQDLLQHNNFLSFKMSSGRLARCLQDAFKTSSRRICKTSSRRLQDVLEDEKLLRWRRVKDVFKACLEDVFKTSRRPTNVCWDGPVLTRPCLNLFISWIELKNIH